MRVLIKIMDHEGRLLEHYNDLHIAALYFEAGVLAHDEDSDKTPVQVVTLVREKPKNMPDVIVAKKMPVGA